MKETMGYIPENEVRRNPYSMNRVSIEPIKDSNGLPDALRGLDWPLELNGKGVSRAEAGEMTIRYPKGDVLLSYVTAIHEMGHLRQHELNPELHDLENQTHENLMAEESDAWGRGWRRFAEANPKRLEEFERIVRDSDNDRLKNMGSFAQLYEYVRDNSLKLVEMQRVLFETEDENRGFELLAEDIDKTGWNAFLTKIRGLRIGQTVDTEQMDGDIRNVMEKVIEEQ